MRRAQAVDVASYFKAIAILARNPVIVLAPLAAAMANAVLATILPPAGGVVGMLNGGIFGLLAILIDGFGVGVAIIAADAAWRYGKTSFETAWDEGRRKIGDIFFAALGMNFAIWAAMLVGGFLSPILALVLAAVATFFLIYTLPAAAIGGVPGTASLQISIDRVKANYLGTALLFVVAAGLYIGITVFGTPQWIALATGTSLPIAVLRLIDALVRALVLAYIAVILAKAYGSVSFTPPRW